MSETERPSGDPAAGDRAGQPTKPTRKKRGRAAAKKPKQHGRKRPARKSGAKNSRRPARAAELQSFALTVAAAGVHPDPTKQRALAGYLKHGTITAATAAAGVDRGTWYDWLEKDERFRELAVDAEQAAADALEQKAHQRAKKGSDTLLIFLLKSLRRSKFGDRQIVTLISPEVQVALRQTLELIASKPTWESEELLQRMEALWK